MKSPEQTKIPPDSSSPTEPPKRPRANSPDTDETTSSPTNYEALAEAYKDKLIILARAHAALLTLVGTKFGPATSSNSNEDFLLSSSQLSDEPPSLSRLPEGDEASDKQVLPLLRWDSIASQRSAFSNLVQGCEELEKLSELEEWMNVRLDDDGDDVDNDERGMLLPHRLGMEEYSNGVVPHTSVANSNDADNTKNKSNAHVRVGVGVLVKNPKYPNKVFAGLRKNSHGDGLLALPGGHLEMNESWADCAFREVLEETGLRIQNIQFAHVTNDPMPEDERHSVTIFMQGECMDEYAIPENLEPEKCEGWESYSWGELKGICKGEREDLCLFGPLRHLVEEEPKNVLGFLGNL